MYRCPLLLLPKQKVFRPQTKKARNTVVNQEYLYMSKSKIVYYLRLSPPSTLRMGPIIQSASFLQSKSTTLATSPGCVKLLDGLLFVAIFASASLPGITKNEGVSVVPA